MKVTNAGHIKSVHLPDESATRLTDLAKKTGLKQGDIIRRAVTLALPQFEANPGMMLEVGAAK